MTCAIENNLEILNMNFDSSERSSDTNVIKNEFSKILDTKNMQSKEGTDLKNAQLNNINTDTNTKSTNNSPMTIGELKNLIKDNQCADTTIMSEVINETALELPIDFTIVQENESAAEMISDAESNEQIIENTTIDNTNDQDTITNEDSTMNKEQILTQPPENLLTLGLINTNHQILKLSDNDNEKIEQNNANNLSSFETRSSKNEFKQFNLSEQQQELKIIEDMPENDEVVVKTDTSKLSDIIDDNVIEELNIESVETELGGNQQESSDLMQNQSPQEQGIKAVIQGEVKFDDITVGSVSQTKNTSTEVNAGRIIEQISKQMENLNSGSKVNMVLNPESLGRVALQLINSKEGLVAQFTVATQDIKNILMRGLAGLKETLLAQGVSVDNITVKLTDSGDSEYQGDWTDREGSHGGFREQNKKHQQKDKKQFEKTMFEIENNDTV